MELDHELSFRFPLVKGDDVRAVQLTLQRAGLSPGACDGIFGPQTREAVLAFQARVHNDNPKVEVDGIVGRDTWSYLFSERTPVAVAPSLKVEPSVATPVGWRDMLKPVVARLTLMHGSPVGTGSVRWCLTAKGVVRDGEVAPRYTEGNPVTADKCWKSFRDPMEKCAAAYGVPVELILATACTESAGRPDRERKESGYVSDNETPKRISIGLMQTLISTARAVLNDPACGRAQLLTPETSIRAGTLYLRQQASNGKYPTNFDPPLAGVAYNSGSIRPGENEWGMYQTRRNPTHVHADSFVEFFNDAFKVFASDPPKVETPSFDTYFHR